MCAKLHILAVLWLSVCIACAVHADERRTLVYEDVIGAPIQDVWDAFTTEDGIRGFVTPIAEVDFKIGGTIRTNYNPEGTLGDDSTITHRILSFEPGRMYTSRVTPPRDDQSKSLLSETWGVLFLEPLGPALTKVRLATCNWGQGEAWDEMEAFFDEGNAYTLNKLKEYLEARDVQREGAEVMEFLHKLVGGEWISEQDMQGQAFLSRSVSHFGPTKDVIISRGWIGMEGAMFDHSALMIWRDPVWGFVRFQNVNESGNAASGTITQIEPGHLLWDWQATFSDNDREGIKAGLNSERYDVHMYIEDDDHYRFELFHHESDGSLEHMVTTHNSRVEHAPSRFHVNPRGEKE